MKKVKEQEVEKELNSYKEEAKEILKDKDKTEKYLEKIEEKLRTIKGVGPILGQIPVLISLVRAYIRKEYTQFPFVSVIGILTSLLYFLNPMDIVPDVLIGAGLVDDALAVTLILKLLDADLSMYKEWKKEKNKE